MKVAIVHDWLINYAGAEKVLQEIIEIFPQSELYSIIDFIPQSKRGFLLNKSSKTSFLQKLPFIKKYYRFFLPFMPLAIEQFNFSNYDVVISSSHAVAKGIITGPDQFHICYCHTPLRYAWDLQSEYLKKTGNAKIGIKSFFIRWILHKIRIWDFRTSAGVDRFVSNSNYIGKRIKKVYGRSSFTIYPPLANKKFKYLEKKKDYYLCLSRLVPYKNIDLIVRVFSHCFKEKKLIIIGSGPDYKKIKKISGKNVTLLGYQEDEVVRQYLAEARAFIFAAEEDFGIAPLEAQASGTPVIAYGRGGALETIVGLEKKSSTGVFFYEPNEKSLADAIKSFEKNSFKILSKNCLKNSKRFSSSRFKKEFTSYLKKEYSNWKNK